MMENNERKTDKLDAEPAAGASDNDAQTQPQTGERGGPKGPEPTRYGDWEKGGRCTDF